MMRLIFDTADTLVFDPVAANRNATRTTLYNIGFRRIETVSNLDAFAEAVKRRPPDLALCEAHGGVGELCTLIQNLRLGVTVYNPFIVIIVTAWEQSSGLVSAVLNSGADDLLLRPFSATMLEQRIVAHIERRKGFVITSDYVGPDRRRESTPASSAELFQPPNSLKMKTKERLTSELANQRLDQELKDARESLITEKLRRDAFQICVLWRLTQGREPGANPNAVDLSKLKEAARGVARRSVGTTFESAIPWCESVLAAIEGLEVGVDRNASMHLLGHAALNLNRVFKPDASADEQLSAIDATVALVRARMEAKEARERGDATAAAM